MPKVKEWESKREYVARCVTERQEVENQDEPVSQSVAICIDMYKDQIE